jgi:hypothetical protein
MGLTTQTTRLRFVSLTGLDRQSRWSGKPTLRFYEILQLSTILNHTVTFKHLKPF